MTVDPTPQPLVGGPSPAAAIVLARAVCRAADFLGLSTAALAKALASDEGFALSLFTGQTTLDPLSDHGQQALRVIRIYRALDSLVGHDSENRTRWMRGRVQSLDGIPALLVQEPNGLSAVVGYLEGVESMP